MDIEKGNWVRRLIQKNANSVKRYNWADQIEDFVRGFREGSEST